MILTVDRNRMIHFMSRVLNEHTPERMIGQDAEQLFPRRVRSWFRRTLRAAFFRGEGSRFQYPTEESVWWEIRVIPRCGGERIEEVLLIATDVTEARILQARTIRHARLATIGVLAASIAHEINNPNNAILFNVSLLTRAWRDALPILDEYLRDNGDFQLGGLSYTEARDLLPAVAEEIGRNTLRLKSIIENLKHLARRDSESLHETFDIHEPLQAALMILNHKIRVHTDHCKLILAHEELTVRGNSRQLEQVFINVILNALQALPERSKPVWIRVAREENAQDLEARVLITVEDQGSGILPEHLSQLTEPFFSTRAASGGTGLGLSISGLIIRNHRGSLHFVSTPGKGTTVSIRLPLHRAPGDSP
ncbi:MAG: ATP-binding protein [Magnetococcus sp. YQC-9]